MAIPSVGAADVLLLCDVLGESDRERSATTTATATGRHGVVAAE
jgi:hypothetical protein